jgi:hypothetical protein
MLIADLKVPTSLIATRREQRIKLIVGGSPQRTFNSSLGPFHRPRLRGVCFPVHFPSMFMTSRCRVFNIPLEKGADYRSTIYHLIVWMRSHIQPTGLQPRFYEPLFSNPSSANARYGFRPGKRYFSPSRFLTDLIDAHVH